MSFPILKLPTDIIRNIVYLLDPETLMYICEIKYFREKICNDIFWIGKIMREFPLSADEIREEVNHIRLNYMQYFMDLEYSVYNKQNLLLVGSESGKINLVKIALRRGADIHIHSDIALRRAVVLNHIEIVKFLLENGADVHIEEDLCFSQL